MGRKRAVFGPANVLAETHRQLHGLAFADGADRLAVAARVSESALAAASGEGGGALSTSRSSVMRWGLVHDDR